MSITFGPFAEDGAPVKVSDWITDQAVEDAWTACEKAAADMARAGRSGLADDLNSAAKIIRWSWEKLTAARLA